MLRQAIEAAAVLYHCRGAGQLVESRDEYVVVYLLVKGHRYRYRSERPVNSVAQVLKDFLGER